MNIFISKKSQIGWALYDWASSPVPTLHATFIFSVYFTTVIMPEGGSVVWAYMTGITAILVAMVAPFLGSYADSSGKFKELIVFFICLCFFYRSMHAYNWVESRVLVCECVGVRHTRAC